MTCRSSSFPLTRFLGSTLGLLVFAIMILRGMAVANPVEVVLSRAIGGLLAGVVIGVAVGGLADRIIRDGGALSTDTLSKSNGETPGDGATRPGA